MGCKKRHRGQQDRFKIHTFLRAQLGGDHVSPGGWIGFVPVTGRRRINEKLEGSIASTEPPTNGYNYIYNPVTNDWHEYWMPPEDYVETDLNYLFDKFWDGAKFVGRYVVPLEDAIILIDGKDWDGLEQSRVKTAGWFAVGLFPGG